MLLVFVEHSRGWQAEEGASALLQVSPSSSISPTVKKLERMRICEDMVIAELRRNSVESHARKHAEAMLSSHSWIQKGVHACVSLTLWWCGFGWFTINK